MGLLRIKNLKPLVDRSFSGSKGTLAFQYYRVVEHVTVFAWIDLLEMKQLANDQFKMDILYGDTDSIFVSGINVEQDYSADAFTIMCKRNLGVDAGITKLARNNMSIRDIPRIIRILILMFIK